MPINVSEALDADTCAKVMVERVSPGSYVNGLYVPGTTSNFGTLASPQQPTPKQLEMVPEGERDTDIMLFICKRKVRTGDDSNDLQPDIILWNNERWKVVKVADWSTFGHTMAFGAKT